MVTIYIGTSAGIMGHYRMIVIKCKISDIKQEIHVNITYLLSIQHNIINIKNTINALIF